MLDLFSGIGGFALAASWVWSDLEIEAFVEIDSFCQKVLKKNFPGVPIYGDITKIKWIVEDSEFKRWPYRQNEESQSEIWGQRDTCTGDGNGIHIQPIDLLTGGFPCQPFSCAGQRKGTEDHRFLWGEMYRTICEVKPRWVLAENVPGILSIEGGLVVERVLSDLEDAGYEVLPLVIPACGKGAPHRRDRVWIVGNAKCSRRQSGEVQTGNFLEALGRGKANTPISADRHVADTKERSFVSSNESGPIGGSDARENVGRGCVFHAPDTQRNDQRPGLCEGEPGREWRRRPPDWNGESWYEIATRFCRVSHGVPNRVDRLKCLGNAIVPQVAVEIMRAIKETDLF